METPGQRIRSRRQELGKTMLEVADELGITDDKLRTWEIGRVQLTRNPRMLKAIAALYGVTPEWIESGDETRPADLPIRGSAPLGELILLPLYRGALGSGEEEYSFSESDDEEMSIPSLLIRESRDKYALIQVLGPSMSKRIEHTEYVLVKKCTNPPIRSLVCAMAPNKQHFIKKLMPGTYPYPYELHPLNPAYNAITQVKDWILKASVVAILKNAPEGEPNLEWNYDKPLRA